MTDGVIKGTGNSWNLKSVPNFLTLYPTYEAFVQALVAGTLPIDLNGMNAAGWSTQGTPLNKANLLTDATEKAIWGAASNRSVNQAMAQLRSLITTAQTTANGRLQTASGTYSGTGVYGESNPNQLTLPFKPVLMVVEGDGLCAIFYCYKATGAYTGGAAVLIGSSEITLAQGSRIFGKIAGNTYSWYNIINEYYQLNRTGYTFTYLALG